MNNIMIISDIKYLESYLRDSKAMHKSLSIELSLDRDKKHFPNQIGMVEQTNYYLARCITELDKLVHDLKIEHKYFPEDEE